MAYAKRLQVEYKDINDIDSRIEVETDGFVGAATYREYASGNVASEISSGDKSGVNLPVIYGSSITLFFDSETNFEFSDFFSSNSRKNRIKFYKNNQLMLVTFGEADTWGEPLQAAPYEVSFTGYDGLGLLKNEDFRIDKNTPYEGLMTPLEILTICLAKTGHQLNINTAVNIRPAGLSAAVDALTQVEKDVIVYADLTCYEVLEQVFQNCRIYQRGGEWHVVSNNNFSKSLINTYRYDYTGASIGAGSFNPRTEKNWWLEGKAGMTMMPGLKYIDIEQDFGYKENLVENGNFETADLSGWTVVGAFTPVVKTLTDKDEKYIYLPGQENIQLPPTKYIKQSFNVQQSENPVKLTLDYALFGDHGDRAHMFIMIELIGSSTTRYLVQKGDPATKKIAYTWSSFQEDERRRLLMNFHYSDNYANNINADRVGCSSWEDLSSNFRAWEAIIPGFFFDGEMVISLCIAQTNDDNINGGACFKNLKSNILDENQELLPVNRSIRLTNTNNNNYVPDEIKVVNGDLPDLDNNKLIYNGGWLLTTGEETSAWNVDGLAGTYGYIELLARFFASAMRKPRQAYEVSLADMYPGTDMVIEDAGIKLVEAGITYNDRMQTISGRYVEVLDDTLVGDDNLFVIEETTGHTTKSSSSGGGSSSSSVDHNDRVSILNELGEEELPPSSLHDEYFEGLANEFTSPLIKPKSRLIHRNPIAAHTAPVAAGNNAIAIGEGTTADIMRQLTLGCFNSAIAGSASAWAATDPLLVIGNGADDANRSNAAVIYKSGYVILNNALKIGDYQHGVIPAQNGTIKYDATGLQLMHIGTWGTLLIDVSPDNKAYGRKNETWVEVSEANHDHDIGNQVLLFENSLF